MLGLMGCFISSKGDKLWMSFIIIELLLIFSIFVFGIRIVTPNHYVKVVKLTDISSRSNMVDYKELNEVNECINKGYNGEYSKLDSSDYYYDYLNIVLTDKSMSVSELWSYMKKTNDNLIYSSVSNLHKATVKLKLEGLLKTEIEKGVTMYLINGYVLGVDEKSSIASLANNQKISLDIIYDKDLYKNDKKITAYKIINADTN